jgi:hypothetical protein
LDGKDGPPALPRLQLNRFARLRGATISDDEIAPPASGIALHDLR